MASSKRRYRPHQLWPIATHLRRVLGSACTQIEIVGSLRRCHESELIRNPPPGADGTVPLECGLSEAAQCGISDIEILALPKPVAATRSLFPSELEIHEDPGQRTALCDLVEDLTAAKNTGIIWDPVLKRRGTKYKRLAFQDWAYHSGGPGPISIDLFVVTPPASWGCLQAIRTGPAEFSRLLVTSREKGGALPNHMVAISGALKNKDGWIQPATEEEYFAAVGLPCWPPAERSAEKLRDWLRRNDSAGEEPQ